MKPQYTVQDVKMKEENFVADLLVPDILREPELFDNCIGEALYGSWYDNRKVAVQTRINTKDNTIGETQPSTSDRQAEQAEQTPEIQQSNKSNQSSPSQFNTPDSQINESVSPTSSDSSFRIPTRKNQLPVQSKTAVPSEPSAPVSKLARFIGEKRVERQAGIAQQLPSSTVTPANGTNSRQTESPQVANTVSGYDRVRKQTQRLQSIYILVYKIELFLYLLLLSYIIFLPKLIFCSKFLPKFVSVTITLRLYSFRRFRLQATQKH